MNNTEVIGTEDLRFVYKSILDGYSDSEILNMYNELISREGRNVQVPAGVGFIENRRKEMEVISEILKESIEKIIKLSVPNQKEGHFAQINEISAILIENNLDTLVEYPGGIREGPVSKYTGAAVYTIKDRNGMPVQLNRMELIGKFTGNVERAVKVHGVSFFYDCYASHLQATFGEEMEAAGGFWPEVEKNPYKVIKTIESISGGKGIKGICPVCNMETQLPPFLRSVFGNIFRN